MDLAPRDPGDPLHHVRKMGDRLASTAAHLRKDAAGVEEPLFQTMFEGAAEVLDRLVEAFRTYEDEGPARS